MEALNIAQVLDELAEQARDEESIYRAAAIDADELSVTAFSVSCAVLCRERAEELEGMSLLYSVGGKSNRYYFAPLARGWNRLRTFFHVRNDREIIEDCKRHEDGSLRAYERAVGLPLPGTLRTALNNHMSTMRDCHTGLRRLHHHLWQRANLAEPVALQASC